MFDGSPQLTGLELHMASRFHFGGRKAAHSGVRRRLRHQPDGTKGTDVGWEVGGRH